MQNKGKNQVKDRYNIQKENSFSLLYYIKVLKYP